MSDGPWQAIHHTPGDPQPLISDGVYRGVRSDGRGGYEGILVGDKPHCMWALTDPDLDLWSTSCGEAHTFLTGGPAENGMRFCCYCGLPMEEKANV